MKNIKAGFFTLLALLCSVYMLISSVCFDVYGRVFLLAPSVFMVLGALVSLVFPFKKYPEYKWAEKTISVGIIVGATFRLYMLTV